MSSLQMVVFLIYLKELNELIDIFYGLRVERFFGLILNIKQSLNDHNKSHNQSKAIKIMNFPNRKT